MTRRLTPSDRLHRMKFNQDFRFRRFAEAQAARCPAAFPRRRQQTSALGQRLAFYAGSAAALVVVIVEILT